MSQNARIGALTDELVRCITDFSPETNAQAYKHAKDLALRKLKGHHYARTNQFHVQASLDGLDEKFRVLSRDDLADALKERLTELQRIPNKWTPELLSLLLQLSDRPVENSKVEDLEVFAPPKSLLPLTWAEIIAEDPPSDEELWKDIDYAAESSEDETRPDRQEKTSMKKALPSSIEDDTYDTETCVEPVDKKIIRELETAQFWRTEATEDTGKVTITELQTVRETLFMLTGLETSLYTIDGQSGSIHVVQKFILSHTTPSTTNSVLSQLADIGHDLYRLRQWPHHKSSFPLIQTFEAAVTKRLADFDRYLASSQQSYLFPKSPFPVSILEVHNEVRKASNPLRHLAKLVSNVEPLLYVNPFAHLETLFDRINLAQITLEQDVFEYLGTIFFECLQTYLKPIRKWMELGQLGHNDETFFIFENDSGSENSSLWHDRFVLRRGQGNALRSPNFLEPAAKKIFNTGKSVIFLKELGIRNTGISAESEPRLDFESVCGTDHELPLAPFSELFGAAFETWIRSKYSLASNVLRSKLLSECGLLRIIEAFKHLFLAANGSTFQDFASAIFERMDSRRRGWNDRYLLTELAHAIYATGLDPTDVERIVVRSSNTKKDSRSVKSLSSVTVDYALPWPVMNIIQRSSIPIYQQVFTFLLQTYRAKYLLQNTDWKALSSAKAKALVQLSYKLRHHLIWFADNIRAYLTDIVFGPSTEALLSQLTEAQDIDEMSDVHMKYIARLQEQSLLSSNLKPIHQAIISLLDLAVLFSDIHSSEPPKKNASVPLNSQADPNARPKMKSKKSRKSIIPTIVDDASSDSEEEGTGEHNASPTKAFQTTSSFSENLNTIQEQFDSLLPFVIAGLRSVSRAGGELCWEMLAEKLEWDKPKGRFEVA
ncbi:hypothetical protein GQ43DRAFT_484948 [Delitschia confertaspora ATCC 74209]|uniref:Spindle pole body component n=1 Tax=Delitschia confertaspora ATCC 74209 TaxID=1513339 RepID=A0A9P4JDS2_9PLEO|nr:hypothetical protein GQ43DRAFT_484948 [Delitschia confertaspora ATCC 74209]